MAGEPLLLRGTITEAGSAKPVAGGQVTLEVRDMRERSPMGFESTTTAPDGTYQFDLSEKYGGIPLLGLQVNAISPLHREVLKIEKVESTSFPFVVDLSLNPGCSAEGRVTDSDGKPVPEAIVDAPGARRTKTDADGRFVLLGLRAESANRLTARKQGFANGTADLEPAPQGVIPSVSIVLTQGFDLKGRVVAPDGETPVGGGTAYLYVGTRYREEKVGRDGTFFFKNVPVGGELEMRHWDPRHLFAPRPLTEAEIAAHEVVLRLLPAAFLSGTITGADGKPSGASRVVLEIPGETGAMSLPVRYGGRWESGPLPMDTAIQVVALSGERESQRAAGELEFSTTDGEITAKVDPWPAGFISRFTVRKRGDGRIEMQRRDEGVGGVPGTIRYVGQLDEAGMLSGEVLVEGSLTPGRFTARPYSPSGKLDGVWDLREELPPPPPSGPGYLKIKTPPFAGRQVVAVPLSTTNSLSGRALKADGTPVENGEAYVDGWKTTSSYRFRVPISGGVFYMDSLPPEPIRLVVRDGESGDVSVPKWVRPGGVAIEVKIGEAQVDDGMDSLNP